MAGGKLQDEAAVREAVAASLSVSEALRRLGVRHTGSNWTRIKKVIARLEISTDHFDRYAARRSRKSRRYDEAAVREAVAASLSLSETVRRLGLRPAGGNPATIKKLIARLEIPTDHFDPWAAQRAALRQRPVPLSEVLVEGST